MHRSWVIAAAILLGSGCTEQVDSAPPGARGPVILRVWDQTARVTGGTPTVLVADTLRQEGDGFDRIALEPVTIRHPLQNGIAWIRSPRGGYQSEGGRFHLDGPVHFSGVMDGRLFTGSAAQADGSGKELVLTDAAVVRGDHLVTSQRLILNDGRMRNAGSFSLAPGAPAVQAALAAWE